MHSLPACAGNLGTTYDLILSANHYHTNFNVIPLLHPSRVAVLFPWLLLTLPADRTPLLTTFLLPSRGLCEAGN